MKEKIPSIREVAEDYPKKSEEGPDLTRRSILLGGAAGFATLLSPKIIRGFGDALDFRSEKQRTIDNALSEIQKNLRRPEVLEALQGRGERPLATIFSAMEIPILPEHLEGTSYDVTKLHEMYPFQLLAPHSEQGARIASSDTGSERYRRDGENIGYGNGILWRDRNTILTAEHVARVVQDRESGIVTEGLDVETVSVWDEGLVKNIPGVAADDPTLTDDMIHGNLAVIVGIDPDSTSDSRGHKTYPGIAIKITPGLARILSKDEQDPETLAYLEENSFMLILPPGEAKEHAIEGTEDSKYLLAQGMSGSAMFVHHNGAYTLGGILWGALSFSSDRRTVDLGFVHGIDSIRSTLAK